MGDRIVSRWSNLNGRYIGPIKKMRDKVYSAIDFNDHNNEYVIEDMQGDFYTRITHYVNNVERGLMKVWHVHDITANDVYDCMVADEVINDGYADGDKIEEYIENELDFDFDLCIGGELFRV